MQEEEEQSLKPVAPRNRLIGLCIRYL